MPLSDVIPALSVILAKAGIWLGHTQYNPIPAYAGMTTFINIIKGAPTWMNGS